MRESRGGNTGEQEKLEESGKERVSEQKVSDSAVGKGTVW